MHTPEMAEGNVRDLMHELAAMAPNERVPFLARALNSDGSWPGDSATNRVIDILPHLKAGIPTSTKPANAHLHAHRTYSFSMG